MIFFYGKWLQKTQVEKNLQNENEIEKLNRICKESTMHSPEFYLCFLDVAYHLLEDQPIFQ